MSEKHPEDLPWNDVPADSDARPGSDQPDPAEVTGEEGEEYDPASPRIPDPAEKYQRDTLDQRLAEEEPDRPARRSADSWSGELQEATADDDVQLGEVDEVDPTGDSGEPAAEDAAVHIQPERGL